MSFDSYKTIAEVLTAYSITSIEERYIVETEVPIRDAFREELEFCLREFAFEESEAAVCETIIFPVLKEAYRNHRDRLALWSHKAIAYDEQLSGTPDYILAKRSPLGKQVFEKPYLVAIEAKKDDFIKGWAQCLAEMVAIQKINQLPEQTVFGIVSNGQLWQFGKLKAALFVKEVRSYTISDLERLFAAINYVFGQCQLELDEKGWEGISEE
ncbi:MAG: hypothetical protein F6J93_04365 [Oscillatoria sp. SIO1A7]|nr:hypothetical protein [Oscillatoria sp. SIO1A7]